MFRKLFAWLDKKLGKNNESWGRTIDNMSFSIYILQLIFILAFSNAESSTKEIAIFLLNTFLVPVAICVYPFWYYAKKKYKKLPYVYWGPKELFAPILVLGFYCVELACIIKAIVQQ